ncbi:MAG: hypothetical protein PWQ73_390, partial [Petrotoga sp.]|nr:hypothetical protein [Petrotoga sp.]
MKKIPFYELKPGQIVAEDVFKES